MQTFRMSNTTTMSTKKRVFRCLVSPPKLRTLASHQMALIVCQHVAHDGIDDDCDEWDTFADAISGHEHIPSDTPAIVKKVRDKLRSPVGFSIDEWCGYHIENVFIDCNIHDAMLNCIDEFILTPYGTISFLATAKNILLSDKFDIVEKFRMACIHCLVDDVRSIWPLASRNPRIVERNSNSHPLIRYWISVMKVKSQRLPVGENYSDSLEDRLKVFDKMQWPAIQYFWNILSDEEQVALAPKIMKRYVPLGDSSLMERLLLQLNDRYIKKIFKRIDIYDMIFDTFVENCMWNHNKVILRIWNCIIHFIPVDKVSVIITKFVENGFIGEYAKYHYIGPLLFQMWTDTPVQLKRYVSLYYVKSIFHSLHSKIYDRPDFLRTLDGWNFDMRFFIAVLNDLSFQTRNELWCKYWTKFIIGTVPKCLEEMMKLCFNNEDEIVQFKEGHMLNPEKIDQFCILLMQNNHISELEEYFKFCSSNVYFVAIVKRHILGLPDIPKAFLLRMSNEKFYEFDKFIDSAYFVDEDARNYKRKLMLPSKSLQDTFAGLDRARLGVSWI